MTQHATQFIRRALQGVRRDTERCLESLTEDQCYWLAPGGKRSIAALALHIGEAEWDWTGIILGREASEAEYRRLWPAWIDDQRPAEFDRIPLETIHARLQETRAALMEFLRDLEDSALAQERAMPGRDDGPTLGWILYHLIEHEAHHRGQIALLRSIGP